MTIVVDGRWLSGRSGIARYANSVCAGIGHSIKLIQPKAMIGSPLSPISLARSLYPTSGNLFWTPGFTPPLYSRMPVVCTIHDLNHLFHYDKKRRVYYELAYKPLLKNAQGIIAVSQFTKDLILDWLNIPDENVHVIYHGVDDCFTTNGSKAIARRPFLLYPGNFRKYKNVDGLLRAFAHSKMHLDLDLWLTAPPNDAIVGLIRALKIDGSVLFQTDLDDVGLASAYRAAVGTVFVSYAEGFGLPILESMASGTPVLTSSASCLPEVAGDAAIFSDPHDIESISNGLQLLVYSETLRNDLRNKGLERAKHFTWTESIRKHNNIFNRFS